MCRCCFFFLRLPSNSVKQFFFSLFFFDGASQIQGDSGRELELRGKKEKPFREIPFSFYVSIDLFLRLCLVSHFRRFSVSGWMQTAVSPEKGHIKKKARST